MNRCPAFNKNNKKCRSLTKNNNLFCCKDHEPINNNIINDGCFICMDKIVNSNDIIYFKCKHAFHKGCYIEWLKFSTYDEPICILCRNNVSILNVKKKSKKNIYNYCSTIDLNKITNIQNILGI